MLTSHLFIYNQSKSDLVASNFIISILIDKPCILDYFHNTITQPATCVFDLNTKGSIPINTFMETYFTIPFFGTLGHGHCIINKQGQSCLSRKCSRTNLLLLCSINKDANTLSTTGHAVTDQAGQLGQRLSWCIVLAG